MFARETQLTEYLTQSAAVWEPEKVNTELDNLRRDLDAAACRETPGEPKRDVPSAEELKRMAGYPEN